jgi:hypothetical protein
MAPRVSSITGNGVPRRIEPISGHLRVFQGPLRQKVEPRLDLNALLLGWDVFWNAWFGGLWFGPRLYIESRHGFSHAMLRLRTSMRSSIISSNHSTFNLDKI